MVFLFNHNASFPPFLSKQNIIKLGKWNVSKKIKVFFSFFLMKLYLTKNYCSFWCSSNYFSQSRQRYNSYYLARGKHLDWNKAYGLGDIRGRGIVTKRIKGLDQPKNDYFSVTFDHFWREQHFLAHLDHKQKLAQA